MLKKVSAAVHDYGMFEESQNVTVALSGGADSVALLYCLLELKDEFSLNISAVHLNHMLRGEEADRDERFVTDLCKTLCVPLTVKRVDINAAARLSGESIELTARRIRYELFLSVNRGVVATAHTASDSLETMLFNLSRGAGIKGLCGIPPTRGVYVRPLIYCTRQDVERYCQEHCVSFVNDSTNFTDEYTRNKIRLGAVPVLRRVNPSLEASAMRTAQLLREDDDFISSVVSDNYNSVVKNGRVQIKALHDNHPAVAKRILKRVFAESFSASLDFLHTESLYDLALKGSGYLSMPENVTAKAENGEIYFFKGEDKPEITFKTEIRNERIKNIKNVNTLLLKNLLDCDKITGKPVLRTRLPQDKIRLANRGVTKTLKKIFTEEKVPENLRDTVPVISDDRGVIWVYGIGVSERVRVDEKTENVCVIECEKIIK